MKTYVCSKCGYTTSINDNEEFQACPSCGFLDEYNMNDSLLADNEIDAIIDSIIEDAFEEKENKIINKDESEKYLIIDEGNKIINRISDKCINCGQCKKVCEKIANLKYDLNKDDKPLCINCGQCIVNCPSNALIFKDNYREVKQIINLNEKIVVALVDPTCYLSLEAGSNEDVNYEKKFVSALRRIGFDYVFNSGFASDLKILEEVTEFAERLKSKQLLPMFTSSCPSWVEYVKLYHPEIISNISTCKDSEEIHSALIKSYFCEDKGFEPSKIVTVSITTCTAKNIIDKNDKYALDYNLTLNEIMEMCKEEEIIIKDLEDKDYDPNLSENSGASLLLGTLGGECESFTRTLYRIMSKSNLNKDSISIKGLRNIDGIKEASIQVGDYKFRVAIVDGLVNLEKIIANDAYKKYHYVEVMTCKSGCINGSGEPFTYDISEVVDRKNVIYNEDENKKIRCAHDNAELKALFRNFLGKPLSEKCLELFHKGYKKNNSLQ